MKTLRLRKTETPPADPAPDDPPANDRSPADGPPKHDPPPAVMHPVYRRLW